jgi:uncharacterized membrane protein YbhN (UPF0104 family)
MNVPTRLRRFLVPAALVACVIAGGIAIAHTWAVGVDQMSPSRLRWQFVALSALSGTAFVCVYAVCWWLLLSALERRRVPLGGSVRLFLLAWPGRYVPGSLPYYGGRLIAAPRLGVSRASAAASLVYENLFAIATSGALSLLLLLLGFRDRLGGGPWFALACVAAVSALAALHPAVVRTIIRLSASRIRRLSTLDDHVLGLRSVLRLIPAYAAGSLLAGFAFYFALLSISGAVQPPLLLALATYNLAGVAGLLALPVPSGVGVREGVTVALIGAVVSPPVALSAAVLARFTGILADLIPGAAIVSLGIFARVRRMHSRGLGEARSNA